MDRTNDLQVNDFFRFNRIIVISRKTSRSRSPVVRFGEHRGQRHTHTDGHCYIDRLYEFINE